MYIFKPHRIGIGVIKKIDFYIYRLQQTSQSNSYSKNYGRIIIVDYGELLIRCLQFWTKVVRKKLQDNFQCTTCDINLNSL